MVLLHTLSGYTSSWVYVEGDLAVRLDSETQVHTISDEFITSYKHIFTHQIQHPFDTFALVTSQILVANDERLWLYNRKGSFVETWTPPTKILCSESHANGMYESNHNNIALSAWWDVDCLAISLLPQYPLALPPSSLWVRIISPSIRWKDSTWSSPPFPYSPLQLQYSRSIFVWMKTYQSALCRLSVERCFSTDISYTSNNSIQVDKSSYVLEVALILFASSNRASYCTNFSVDSVSFDNFARVVPRLFSEPPKVNLQRLFQKNHKRLQSRATVRVFVASKILLAALESLTTKVELNDLFIEFNKLNSGRWGRVYFLSRFTRCRSFPLLRRAFHVTASSTIT